MLRTHTCGQLTEKNLSQEAILCGWVDSRRDHGKIIFIDVRDRYGLTQVFFSPKPHVQAYEQAKKMRNEDVVMIKGVVNNRPKGTENPKIPTGFIELHATEVTILNASDDIPFMIAENIDAGEEVRLMHRYLDLRRKNVLNRFMVRHQCNQAFRTFLNGHNFLEIETPFLTKSTPEGARDYLVPSRLNPRTFYALPQSPQLFKQILMVAGMDRYYQIVRCFRDEDLRKDRQPEFTQLDVEMSFVEQEDVLSLMEKMFAFVFKEVFDKELPIPFPRMTHQEAMQKYNSDKPDVGEGDYRFLWVVDFPLFEYNEEEKRWQSCHHPFTSLQADDIPLLDTNDLSKIRSCSYDLVLNGSEIASGSVRISNPQLQKKIFEVLGISSQDAENKFGFLLRAFKYGAPPHAGIAFGLDRFYAILTGAESIREVIAFPKTQKGVCPLSDAPSSVDQKQLKELSLELLDEEV